MKNKKVVVIMLIMLVLSSILGGAGLAKNIENDSSKAPINALGSLMGEVSAWGKDFTRIEGDWVYAPGWAIEMSPSSGYCWADWDLNLGVPKIQDGSLQIGLEFCDRAGYPWVNGPDLYVYNWNTSSYDGWKGVGTWDDYEFVWKTPADSNAYVNQSTGLVRVHVYVSPDCDTFVGWIRVKYQELPGSSRLQVSPTSFTWKRAKQGSTIQFSFIVANVGGDDAHYLNWWIGDPIPRPLVQTEHGTWSFTPSSGRYLSNGSSVTVDGTLAVPTIDYVYWHLFEFGWDIPVFSNNNGVVISCTLTTMKVRSLTMDNPFAHFFHGKFANYLEFMQNLIHNK